ncbi:dsDNA nuclease domain-containing protein [Bacillus wiedmannii]|uniref:dsDNA nuclease domain-containing protein n=1 Tax=Bacillus wiedmannii TaxID=1890302 RepID=UPI003CE73A65
MTTQAQVEISEIKLKQRIENFLEENEENLLEEEKQQLIDTLLKGKIPELSGVTAIRGFMYQYYVAANYIMDMVFSKSAWWDKVVFEYLDDIAVSGGRKVRFIQVKTKKERNVLNHLTPSHMCKRTNGKGSWLDKLFLFNTHIPEQKEVTENKKRGMVPYRELLSSSLEFELATNVQYNDDMAIYEKEEDFRNYKSEDDYESVIKILEGNGKVAIFQGSEKGVIVDTSYYNRPLAPKAMWYLKRFRIKRYGNISFLRDSLIGKIKDNSSGNADLFHKYKAEIILDSLLQEIVKRTCQDDETVSSENFIFRKEELEKKFKEWTVQASNSAHLAAEQDSLRAKFTTCFNRIEQDIRSSNWEMNLQKELIDTLEDMRKYLDDQFQTEEDPFVYQRFLQRLFNTSNSQSGFPFDDGCHGPYLRRSLEILLYLSVLYKQVLGAQKNARLLFKELLSHEEMLDIFSLYNVCEQKDIEYAMKIVRISAKECFVSQSFKHDYYCFIADPELSDEEDDEILGMMDCLKADSIHVSVLDPASEEKNLQDMKITKQTENIKFLTTDPIYKFMKRLEKLRVSSFKNEEIIDVWRKFLVASYKKREK